MIKLALLITIVYVFYKFYKKSLPEGEEKENRNIKDVLVKDPNCGKYIPKERSVRIEIDGKIYYFCSLKCGMEYGEKLKKGHI